MNNRFQNEAGYTITELVVAIQISFIVIGLAYIGYLFSSKLFTRWQEKMQAETHIAQVSAVLSKSLDKLYLMDTANSMELVGVTVDGDSINMRLEDRVWLNNQVLGNARFSLQSGNIEYILATNNRAKRQNNIADEASDDPSTIAAIHIDLLFVLNNTTYALNIYVRPINLKRAILNAKQEMLDGG